MVNQCNQFTPVFDYFDLVGPFLVSGTVLFNRCRCRNISKCNNSCVKGRHGSNIGGRTHHAIRGPKTRNQRLAKEGKGFYGEALHRELHSVHFGRPGSEIKRLHADRRW